MNTNIEITKIIDYATMDEYRKWLYENYSIGNGHRLVQLEEDTNALANYLSDMDLPADTELKD